MPEKWTMFEYDADGQPVGRHDLVIEGTPTIETWPSGVARVVCLPDDGWDDGWQLLHNAVILDRRVDDGGDHQPKAGMK